MQERRNSIANALELRLSCTNPLIYSHLIAQRDRVQHIFWAYCHLPSSFDKEEL